MKLLHYFGLSLYAELNCLCPNSIYSIQGTLGADFKLAV